MGRSILFIIAATFSFFPDATKQFEVNLVDSQDCRKLTDGIYSDPNDCHRYFHCSGSKTFYFRCYDGFVFDPCELRCKLRDVCIPAEFCNKNLLQNLTGNTGAPSKFDIDFHSKRPVSQNNRNNHMDIVKLNELLNDADTPAPSGNKRRSSKNQSNSKAFENQYYVPPDARSEENRFGRNRNDLDNFENSPELSTGSREQASTTERLRLAVVRNFNSAESAAGGIFEKSKTKDSFGDETTTIDSFSLHTGYKTSTKGDFWQEGGEQWKTTTAKTGENEIDKSSVADDQERLRKLSSVGPEKELTQSETTTSASPGFRPTITSGTSEAPLTYIVKVVFSRRNKPDNSDDLPDTTNKELQLTTSSSKVVENLHTTTAEKNSSNETSGGQENSARIKATDSVEEKENGNNIVPLNNSLALQKTTTRANFDVFNESTTTVETSETTEMFDINDLNNNGTMVKSNISSATDSSPTSIARAATPLSTINAEDTTTAATIESVTNNENVVNSSALSETKDNETSTSDNPRSAATNQEITFFKVTSDVLTVTLSSAPRQIQGNFSSEELSVVSNITLSCNPTISSALCDKYDNESREALAKHCEELDCNNGGMFISLSNGHCGCVCQTGYKGDSCTDLVDREQCKCQNGGKCVGVGNETYACRCTLGYFGEKCQYPVVDDLQSKSINLLDFPLPGPKFASKLIMDLNKYLLCVVNICANGGICVKEIESGANQCFCGHNFAGRYCEKKCINC